MGNKNSAIISARQDPELAPPGSNGSLLLTLPNVLTQVCFHQLDSTELLAVAQCCRRLRFLIDQPFAWRHTLLKLRGAAKLADPSSSKLAARSRGPSSLLRHARIDLLLDDTDVGLPIEVLLVRDNHLHTELVTAMTVRQVHELPLKLPLFKELRVLRLCSPLDRPRAFTVPLVNAICSLPHLHTMLANPQSASLQIWESLPTAPSLTHLMITDGDAIAPKQCSLLPHIAGVRSLRRLEILYPSFYGASFFDFFSAAPIRQLQRLSIDRFWASRLGAHYRGDSIERYVACFAQLTQLRDVTLRRVIEVDNMLSLIAALPALQFLLIQTHNSTSAPSAAALVVLLDSCPRLQLDLQSVHARDPPPEHSVAIALAFMNIAREWKENELRPFADRIRLIPATVI